jgi:hypothetical protein
MYPASANFGMLTSAECSPGTMFISQAARRRLCLRSIFFVAFPVRPSGNMKVFWDGCPVLSRSGGSSSGAAPEVAPESRKANLLDFLFCSFCTQCAATLLDRIPLAVADMAILTLVVLSDGDSSCSLAGQASRDQ